MARYIDADKLIRLIELANWGEDFLETATWRRIKRYIDDTPTEDVAPVIHARWIFREADECFYPNFLCSNCHEVSAFGFNFCPNCGAEMEEE